MAGNLPNAVQSSPLLSHEFPAPTMAKADLTVREKRALYGAVLRRASELAGFNRDQTATAIGVDPGQLGRWWSGDENPQTWRFTRHARLGPALIVAQAEEQQHIGIVVKMSIELALK